MMAPKDRKRLSEELGKLLCEAGTAGFMRAALEGAPNMLMQPEAEGAARYERSEARAARLNGAIARKVARHAESLGIEIGKCKASRICAELPKTAEEFSERPHGEFPYA
jgi:hypothetical protein